MPSARSSPRSGLEVSRWQAAGMLSSSRASLLAGRTEPVQQVAQIDRLGQEDVGLELEDRLEQVEITRARRDGDADGTVLGADLRQDSVPSPSGSIRSRTRQSGFLSSIASASATVETFKTSQPRRSRIPLRAFEVEGSSSTKSSRGLAGDGRAGDPSGRGSIAGLGEGGVRRRVNRLPRPGTLSTVRSPSSGRQPLRDREPQTEPLAAVPLAVLDLEEVIEDRRLILGSDPLAGISNLDRDIVCSGLDDQLHGTRFRELDRIVDEVRQDPFDLHAIGKDDQPRRMMAEQFQALLLG